MLTLSAECSVCSREWHRLHYGNGIDFIGICPSCFELINVDRWSRTCPKEGCITFIDKDCILNCDDFSNVTCPKCRDSLLRFSEDDVQIRVSYGSPQVLVQRAIENYEKDRRNWKCVIELGNRYFQCGDYELGDGAKDLFNTAAKFYEWAVEVAETNEERVVAEKQLELAIQNRDEPKTDEGSGVDLVLEQDDEYFKGWSNPF